jgi:hypothetical protein
LVVRGGYELAWIRVLNTVTDLPFLLVGNQSSWSGRVRIQLPVRTGKTGYRDF